jgi:hypothetical protein
MVLLLTAIVALLVTLGHLMVDEDHVEDSLHSGVKEKQIETSKDSFVRGKEFLRKNATETTASDKGKKNKNKNKNKSKNKSKNKNKNKRAENATETVPIETETISKNTNATTEKGVTKPERTPIPTDNAANEDKLSEELEELYERLTPQQRNQIENYRKGTALMINIHPTHHAGTSFCGTIGKSVEPLAPAFACMGDKNEVAPNPLYCNTTESDGDGKNKNCLSFKDIAGKAPWKREETGPFIEAIRPYFHMISWEFSRPKMSMDDPEWDHPNLVSVIVTRDPLSRLLAGDGKVGTKYVGYNKGELSRKGWWDYAAYNHEGGTDNFFLRILSTASRQKQNKNDEPIPNHIEAGVNRTTEEMMNLFPTGINETHFEHGKAILDKFTFVLDVDCLNEGMDAMADLLGIDISSKRKNGKKRTYPSPRERIGYEDVYEYLVAKNEWDTALYEYSKTISLVKC